MNRLTLALDQIVFARNYTLGLLKETKPEDWFRIPANGITHVAWQVGHLAFAQYRLALLRIRGEQPHDAVLISEDKIRRFGANSVPDADVTKYPSAGEIRDWLDRIHEQVLQEVASISEAEMDQPVLLPHPLAKTKLSALLWCAHHEMVHAGQIGLLRRLLGYPPMW